MCESEKLLTEIRQQTNKQTKKRNNNEPTLDFHYKSTLQEPVIVRSSRIFLYNVFVKS